MKFWRRRQDRIEESLKALRKSERLGEHIEFQRQEALGISAWARERLRQNHLTELFHASRGRS